MAEYQASRSPEPIEPTISCTYEGSALSTLRNPIPFAGPADIRASPESPTRKRRPRDDASLNTIQFLAGQRPILQGELYLGQLAPVPLEEACDHGT